MMGDILAARKKIVSNPNTPVKKESGPPPPQMKQTMTPTKSSGLTPQGSRSNSLSSKDKDSHPNPSLTSSVSHSTPSHSTPSHSTPSHSTPSHSSITNGELLTLKEEILTEIRKEMERMKEEILAAINSR